MASPSRSPEARRTWYLRNREAILAKSRAYYQRNKERIKARTAAWTEANRDRKNASKRERYKLRHDHFAAKGREYAAKRRATGKAAAHQRSLSTEERNRYNNRYRNKATRELSDFYVRQLLIGKYKIANPTPEQIAERRGIIAAKRAQRAMRMLEAARKISR